MDPVNIFAHMKVVTLHGAGCFSSSISYQPMCPLCFYNTFYAYFMRIIYDDVIESLKANQRIGNIIFFILHMDPIYKINKNFHFNKHAHGTYNAACTNSHNRQWPRLYTACTKGRVISTFIILLPYSLLFNT